MTGHELFGARVEFGEPLFLIVSPSSRHSALTVRCTRYRMSDPAMHKSPEVREFAGHTRGFLFSSP